MQHQAPSTKQQAPNTKYQAPNSVINFKKMLLLVTFFNLFGTFTANAQNSGFFTVNVTTFVSCSEGSNPFRKTFAELIAEGLCLQQPQNSVGGFSICCNVVPTSTSWVVTGGVLQSQNVNNCNVLRGSGTTGSITVSTTINGQTYSYPPLCVDLKISPRASFAFAPATTQPLAGSITRFCSNTPINFTDLSVTNGGTPINNRVWDFGDGTTSQEVNPTHIYAIDGDYRVKYRVTNICYCTSEFSADVKIGRKGLDIVCPSVVCEGEIANYSVTLNPTACTGFGWTVVGGTITSPLPYTNNIAVKWNSTGTTAGFGYVTFNPVACNLLDCYETTTVKVPVIKNTGQLINGDASTCGKEQKMYKLPQWPTTDFKWEIVNNAGTNATLVLTDQRNEVLLNPGTVGGTVTLNCNYYNTLLKCGGIATSKTITIKQEAKIFGDLKSCVNGSSIYSTSQGLSGTWSLKKLPSGATTTFSGVTYQPIFTTIGSYTINYTSAITCNVVLDMQIKSVDLVRRHFCN